MAAPLRLAQSKWLSQQRVGAKDDRYRADAIHHGATRRGYRRRADDGLCDRRWSFHQSVSDTARKGVPDQVAGCFDKRAEKTYDEPLYSADELLGVVPCDSKKPYDVREVVARIADGSEFLDFKKELSSFSNVVGR